MNEPIRTLIIEDNLHFAKSLKMILEKADDMQWVASYHDGLKFLDALQNDEVPEVDVVLLDLGLPGQRGLSLIPMIKSRKPRAQILVLTQDDNYLTTIEAIRLGISGYILKTAGVEEIWSAIRDVNEGYCIIDARLSKLVLKVLTSEKLPMENPLSSREAQVLELLAMGYQKKEVADRLGLKYRSICSYTERIFTKLQVTNIAAAVSTAIRKGLI